MTNIIAGTAGHIDHGKTALVRALTGTDTDRLVEEKRRGISIDIGFAHLDLPGGLRIGFVDVPGHERFVKNMLAGVGGIDFVLFVIAADESIKPQTREHFDICRLLGISSGIVVLTKADLVDEDILALVRLEVEEFIAGSFLAGAPIVPVSSTTAQGMDNLQTAIRQIAKAVRPKDASRYFRLPIDRSFSMHGFGSVVTGTLAAGAVSIEQELALHPGDRRVRVRGIQVHGAPAKQAVAGQRTALNLAGAESAELARGMTLAEVDRFQSTQTIDCALYLLPGAKPLKYRAPVHFHAGTAEIEADVRPVSGHEALEPGKRHYARLRLRDPLLILPGDRFIVRMFSPVVTIGGGTVLDIAPPARVPREQAVGRLKILEAGSPLDRIALLVKEAPFGMSLAELVARTGMLESEIRQATQSGSVIALEEPRFWLLDRQWFAATTDRLRAVLQAFHRQGPLLPGLPKEELRSRELAGAPPFLLDTILAQANGIVSEGEIVRLSGHRLALKQDEEQALSKIEAAFETAGLAVPATQEVLVRSGVELGRARSLLQILLRDRRLVRVGEELVFHHSAIRQLREMLALRKAQRFSVPDFKDWTGVSRKYAIPLLEFLDRERITRRDGDARIVL